jgi:segregation and condensation protein B
MEYNSIDSPLPRGIMLLTFDDSCQLCTMEQYGQHIREALGIRRGGNLSASSIEVLAIVAYNEPVTRAYIDTVRGVDSNYSVNTLCEKHLIEPCGRLDAPGRPMLYRTTEDFLRVFGLNSLSELPEVNLPMKPKEGELKEISDQVEIAAEAETDTPAENE